MGGPEVGPGWLAFKCRVVLRPARVVMSSPHGGAASQTQACGGFNQKEALTSWRKLQPLARASGGFKYPNNEELGPKYYA